MSLEELVLRFLRLPGRESRHSRQITGNRRSDCGAGFLPVGPDVAPYLVRTTIQPQPRFAARLLRMKNPRGPGLTATLLSDLDPNHGEPGTPSAVNQPGERRGRFDR